MALPTPPRETPDLRGTGPHRRAITGPWALSMLLLLAALLPSPAWSTAADAGAPLPPVGTVARQPLAGGEVHRYRVEVPAGHFLRVVAVQEGIDVVVRLLDAGGEARLTGDSPNGRRGPEPLSWIAAEGGPFVVEVASPKADAEAAAYTLRVEALRPATEDDALVVRAERLAARAAQDAWVRRTAESRRAAVDGYRQALELWRRLGNQEEQATTLNNLGFLLGRLGDSDAEAEAFQQLLDLRLAQGDAAEVARSRLNLATARFRLGEFDAAEILYRQALDHFEAHGELARAAGAWNGLGSLHWRLGRLETARQDFLRALELERRQDNPRGEAVVLNNLGLVERNLGHTERAEALFTEALELARRSDDPGNAAAALNNLGVLAEARGRMHRALEIHRQVRDLERQRGNRRGEAYALHNLGYVYHRLGQTDEAVRYFRETLELNRATGERSAEARTLSSLAATYLALEDAEAARSHLEPALELARTLEDRRLEATVLTQLGRVEILRGDGDAALPPLERALALCRELGLPMEEAAAQVQIGRARVAQGHPEGAEEPLTGALATIRRLGHLGAAATALFHLSEAHRAQGDLEAAREALAASLQSLEDLRSSVHIPELRSTLFAERREYHEAYVDLLMELHRRDPDRGWDARAFAAAERARGRSLSDLLREAEVDLRRDADPQLVARAVDLGRRLNALERQRLEAARDGTAGEAREAELAAQVSEARRELLWVEAQMRASSPRYAALTAPAGIDLDRVRRELLEPDVVLLQYSLGEERSFLWRVTRDSFASYVLPPAAEIEAAARRLYELLRRPGSGAEAAARELGSRILAPVAEDLAGARTVAVVADGALHFVPFAALDAGGGPGETPYRPLVADHVVVHLPSLTALSALRDPRPGSADRLLAVFADPVFQNQDPRLAGRPPATPEAGETGEAREAVAEAGGATLRGDADLLELRRLRFSRREAEQIADLVPEDQRLLSFDFDASLETLEGASLERYRYLHFATHGVLDSRYPELSGLVLSLVDSEGRSQEGFLRLHEIYGLDLDAEVVTLSACRTALGQEIRGEGIVGLTRGFMYAGARRVVASLWDVQDRATAEVMARFYRGMLEDGLRPADALRRAQAETWRGERWSDPYYWAAFVMQGDWR